MGRKVKRNPDMKPNLLLLFCFLFVTGAVLSPHCLADTVTCHVVDPTGKPVVGATVYTFEATSENFSINVATVSTDASGNFSMDVASINPSSTTSRQGCIVDVPGLAPGGCIFVSQGNVTIQLSEPVQLTGTVVDDSGKPVGGATVSADFAMRLGGSDLDMMRNFSFLGISPLKPRYTAKTNSDGVYIIPNLPASSTVEVSLNDSGYVDAFVQALVNDHSASPLVAKPATFITGQVVRQDGKPVGPVEVEAMSTDTTSNRFENSSATSDTNGNYKISRISPGEYLVGIVEPNNVEESPGWAQPTPITVTTSLEKPGVTPTIVLAPGGTVTGVVVDSKTKKPVSGVQVCIDNGESGLSSLFRRVVVTTGLKGTYSAEVWDGSAQVTVTGVPSGYANDQVRRSITAVAGQTTNVDPIAIMLELSAVGKVIRADGKPAGPIDLSVVHNVSANATNMQTETEQETANDGSYTIQGLSLGSYTISVDTPGDGSAPVDWVVPEPKTFTTSESGPVKVPDIKLVPGTTVSGTVVDAYTKKPIQGVHVYIADRYTDGTGRGVSAETDQNGKYTFEAWAGHLQVSTSNPPQGYVDKPTIRSFKVIDGQPITLDPIELTPGLTVIGTAVDETGNVVPNVQLQFQKTTVGDNDWFNIPPVTTGADGRFTAAQLLPGSYTLDAGTEWTVVSPSTFGAPSNWPVKLVLKKTVGTTLQGTVVDTAGAPVAGAVLVFQCDHYISDGSDTGESVNATTDSEGFFAVPNVPVDSNMIQRQTVTEDGYVYQSGGDITSQGNQLKISLIVMARLGGKLDGIVRNGLGAPVAGAWVACPSAFGDFRPIQTNSTGRFSFSNLPVGLIDINASKGSYFGTVSAQAMATSTVLTTVTLTPMPAPPPPRDITDGTAMLTKVLADATASKADGSVWWMQDECAALLAGASLNTGLSFISSQRPLQDRDLEEIIPAQSKLNPVAAAQWGIPLILQTKKDGREGAVAASLGLDVAPYDMNAATSLYKLAAQDISIDNLNNNSDDACKLVALAYATKDPNADAMYQLVLTEINKEVAAQTAKHVANMDNDWPLQEFAGDLAQGNVDLAKQIVVTLPENWRLNAMNDMVQALAASNPSGAVDVFHALDADKDTADGYWAYDQALCHVLPILYASDPAGALALAKDVSNPSDRSAALVAIADLLPLAAARPLYQQAENESVDQQGQGASPASIAAHALLRDKTLGDTLFKQAFDNVMASPPSDQPWQGPSYYEFAFYYSRFDPGYSRLLLEGLYQKDRVNETNQASPITGVNADAQAMSAIDPTRALEMAESIKDANLRFQAGQAVAYYMLQSQKTRDTLQFGQWAN
jgi:hypothetical protein